MVNRAVREEALSIYYRRNNFAVTVPQFDLKPFDAWIKHVDDRFLTLIPSIWFIFPPGKDGSADPSAWVQSQRAKFNHTADIQFRGEKREANRFKQAIEIVTELRNQHLGWSTIKDIMQKCNKMADVSSKGVEHLEDYELDTDAFTRRPLHCMDSSASTSVAVVDIVTAKIPMNPAMTSDAILHTEITMTNLAIAATVITRSVKMTEKPP